MADNANPRGLSGVADLRVTYDEGTLTAEDLATDPLGQFRLWFDQAVAHEAIVEPNAMVLATADAAGAPSSRTVLLKGADERGFSFFTNLGSRKSAELRANPRASVTFPWFGMHRQVVVVGQAEELSREEVGNYFRSRPHESQLGAWVSEQSTVIDSRESLDERWRALHEEYPPGTDVPLPEHWGGWLIRPSTVEFWQGRPSRLHDRLRYRGEGSLADASLWQIERLAP
ncbi:MAG TPA: pyridoxamine 5'-phosphate oxidase [Candidatus Nanopelagicales bacterium]|nr:pyridoxamine 5'-phosphate oxidase [Candidatus Nanopelagicales bacterium]